ncbi:ABC transporter substrate-binding protein [Cellulomonas humilata]|uniref:ABC transporter substrate-binding protein n=1 Tax=Cellulomonas humilata TaxID=144055 RepID=A0A7Y6A3F4_9CELL|nr:PhnD/SsuA/transferrin family substrate-binding protein [Cellulomonas humilata]NUU17779.1 ABC transporter substrate-binding protein [Cellulomonas humilata]
MKRVAGLAAAALCASGLLVGCAGTTPAAAPTTAATTAPTAAPTTVRIASLKGPTTMGLVQLMSEAEAGEGSGAYRVTMYGSPDEVVPLVVRGEVDVALLPSNLAAVLYNKTLDDADAQIQVAAISTLGVLDILEAGDTVHSIADLAGKTVYASGKGASPQYVLEHLLTSNGLDPATDLTIEYRSEHTEIAALLATTPGAIALLPQPFATVVTTQNPTIRSALDLTVEWAKVSPDSELVTGVVVVRTAFVAQHPDAVEDFLTDYEASTRFTNEHRAEAAALIAEAGIVPAAPIAEAAIPSSHITFVDGTDLRTLLGGYLQVLFDADPASVGGSVPGDDFYLRR